MSERALWLAVIRQSISDACYDPATIRTGLKADTRASMVRMARGYLNSPDFASVCIMAGLSPTDVRARAFDVIAHYDKTGEFICRLPE